MDTTQVLYKLPNILEEKVKTLSGYPLYHAMGIAWKKNSMEWVHALLERARFLTRNRFGSWEQSRVDVDHMQDYDRHRQLNKTISLGLVNGYPCELSTYGTEDKVKTQFIVLIRKSGPIYIRHIIKEGNVVF